jgi:hypothetical protein
VEASVVYETKECATLKTAAVWGGSLCNVDGCFRGAYGELHWGKDMSVAQRGQWQMRVAQRGQWEMRVAQRGQVGDACGTKGPGGR